MELTNKQSAGLDIALKRFKEKEKYTVISGYAGSGKSTLVKFIISAILNSSPLNEEDICYACYTGKATQVLLKKGNKNVLTLHKLLYDSVPKPDGSFYRKPKITLDYKVIVVDECSMVPDSMVQQLLKHNVYIIWLGDPFQLPPINKDDTNDLLKNPHIFLDEIMRQAQESDIIQLSMQIRNGEKIDYKQGNDVIILPKDKLSTGMLTWADQILCATNKTRIDINTKVRDMAERGPLPEDGDKIICLKNEWDIMGNNGDPLVNGTIGYLSNSYQSFLQLPKNFANGMRVPTTKGIFTSDSGTDFGELELDKSLIITGESVLD